MKKVYKTFSFSLKNFKNKENDGTKGIFEGFASTPALDRDNDIVLPKAFKSSIEDYKNAGKGIVKILFNHNSNQPIGGAPIDKIEIRDEGIYFKDAFIDLNVQKGREIYSLMKNKILDELSIGFGIKDYEINDEDQRVIKDLEWYEFSVVTEPANKEARILDVKNTKEAVKYKDLPLADRTMSWDSNEAIKRVRKFTNSEESPSKTYKNAFLYYDKSNEENFGAYKLPIADVVDGRLKAVPRAIFAAAAALLGARGGVDVTPLEWELIKDNINKYYKKMDMDSPFKKEDEGDKSFLPSMEEVKSLKDVEKYLNIYGFSKKQSTTLVSVMKSILSNKNEDQSDSDFRQIIKLIERNNYLISELNHLEVKK